ncbi:MAG: ethanolamine ammonia-lyase subunit EutB [Gammaproteobacteria bacterium]|nr:ethanolamine ammonia-lyase subunit EutB [Gammaproteobacteria bacterium]
MGELKNFLLTKSEAEIKGIMYGLHSDIIGNVVKLMPSISGASAMLLAIAPSSSISSTST